MTSRALIFDVDGTLAETEEAHRHAFNETFAKEGLDWHWDQALYRELLKTAGGKERMRAYAANHLNIDPARIPVVEIHRRKTERYGELIAEGGVQLRPGIAEMLARAPAAGWRLAMATTTNIPNVDRLIRATLGVPADEVFEAIAAGDMVATKKPAPDVYLVALEKLGLPAQKCLALEDSPNGLRSARAAGVPCVVCPSLYTRGEDFSGAALVVHSFADIADPANLTARFAPA
ncbi:MAG: HAD family hydrolase [Paracoccaceae bacterium]